MRLADDVAYPALIRAFERLRTSSCGVDLARTGRGWIKVGREALHSSGVLGGMG